MANRKRPLVLSKPEPTPNDLHEFRDSWDRITWFRPVDVLAVKALPTRFGRRLLVSLRDGHTEYWLQDTTEARKVLGIQ